MLISASSSARRAPITLGAERSERYVIDGARAAARRSSVGRLVRNEAAGRSCASSSARMIRAIEKIAGRDGANVDKVRTRRGEAVDEAVVVED